LANLGENQRWRDKSRFCWPGGRGIVDSAVDQALLDALPPADTLGPRRAGRALALVLAGVCLGVFLGVAADRLLVASSRALYAARPQEAQETVNTTVRAAAQPAFSRVGNRLVVPDASPLRTLLTVAAPAVKDVARTLVLPAAVEADPSRTVRVMPPVTGRVTELKVQLGGRVTQGDELAVIDSGDLAQAYADIEKAHSAVTLARKALDRLLGLEKSGGVAVKDREQAQSDHAQAVAELDRAEARLRAIGVAADSAADSKAPSRLLSIKAPVSGSVIDLQAARGAFLNDATAAMMTIANLETVWVTANVPEKDIAFVHAGQTVKVTFRSYPDDVFAGKVLFVSDVVEADTRRNKVRIAFDNPDRILKPNMFADARFEAPPASRLVVPTSALLMTSDATSVFVEVADWAFERRNIEIAWQEGAAVAIKAGLRPGERVVVKGAVRLND
jgi:membrane fusion protein, heavy metal efflux system